MVYDNGGLSSSTKLTVTAQPVATTKSLHVEDIKLTLYSSYWYGYYARAQVTVKDQLGVLVPNAVVAGKWSGLVANSTTGKTTSTGVATLWSDSIAKRGTFTFTVTGITLTGYTYAPTQNKKSTASIATP